MRKKFINLVLIVVAMISMQSCKDTEKQTEAAQDTSRLEALTLKGVEAVLDKPVDYEAAMSAVKDYEDYIKSGRVVMSTTNVDFSSSLLRKWMDDMEKRGSKFDKISIKLGIYNDRMVEIGASANDKGKLSIFLFPLNGTQATTRIAASKGVTTQPPRKEDPFNLGDIHPK